MTPQLCSATSKANSAAHFRAVEAAIQALAESLPPDDLATRAYKRYEVFRPDVPTGAKGWGAKGVLVLSRVRQAARDNQRAAAGQEQS